MFYTGNNLSRNSNYSYPNQLDLHLLGGMPETTQSNSLTGLSLDLIHSKTDKCDISLSHAPKQSHVISNEHYKKDTLPQETRSNSNSNKSPSKFTPSPLSLPKRFSLSSVKDSNNNKSIHPTTNQNTSQNIHPNQSFPHNFQQPLYPIQQIPLSTQRDQSNPMLHYQQMFYNPQTGSMMSLPVAQSSQSQNQPQVMYMVPSNHPIQSINQHHPQHAHLIQQHSPHVPPQQQHIHHAPVSQLVYMKTASGQLIPVLTPVSSVNNIPSFPIISPNSKINNNNNNNNNFTQPSNKRQKTSDSSSSSISQSAERLQRQQIQLQLQRNPNINKLADSSNISDIYNVENNNNNENGPKSTTSLGRNNENVQIIKNDSKNGEDDDLVAEGDGDEDDDEDDDDDDANIDQDDNKNSNKLHQVTDNNNISKSQVVSKETPTSIVSSTSPLSSANSVISNDSTSSSKSSKKITGTLTIGSFTYKYSQTLSNNPTKDRELFDRLAENAWKTCMSKR